MPDCRRDQTKFAVFLLVMVCVETGVIFTIMHIEHRAAERQAEIKRAKRRLERNQIDLNPNLQITENKHLRRDPNKPKIHIKKVTDVKTQYDLTWNQKNRRYRISDPEEQSSRGNGNTGRLGNIVPRLSRNMEIDFENAGVDTEYDYDYKEYEKDGEKDAEFDSVILKVIKTGRITMKDSNSL